MRAVVIVLLVIGAALGARADFIMPGSKSRAGTLVTLKGKSGGQRIVGGQDPTENLTLIPNSANLTTGSIILDGQVNLYPDESTIAYSGGNYFIMTWTPTLTAPTALGHLRAWYVNPTITMNAGHSGILYHGINLGGTFTFNAKPTVLDNNTNVITSTIFQSGVAGAMPGIGEDSFSSGNILQATANDVTFANAQCTANVTPQACCTGVGTGTCAGPVNQVFDFTAESLLNATASGAKITVTDYRNFDAGTQVNDVTGGTVIIGTNRAYHVNNIAPGGGGTNHILNQVGLDVDALSAGNTFVNADCSVSGVPLACCTGAGTGTCTNSGVNASFRSATVAGANNYLIQDTGGAQVSLKGKVTTYNNVATAGFGLPPIVQETISAVQTSADVTVFSFTPPATAGRYRVQAVVTTTSGVNTGTIQVTLDYHDSQATVHTGNIIPVVAAGTAAPSLTGTGASLEFHSIPWEFTIDASGTAIALKVVHTGTVHYTVAGSLEQMG